MPKLTGPLLSFGAAGQIAKTQVYASWKGRQYARRYVVPANPNSAAQQLTRNAFSFLQSVWKFWPESAKAAWSLYATNSRFNDINGFMKINLPILRPAADLTNMIVSPSAGSGLVAGGLALAAAGGTITATLTAPDLPSGWAITKAYALAIANVDPQGAPTTDIIAASDDAAPWAVDLPGATSGQPYVVGAWFEFTKSNGNTAYGVSLQGVITPA